MHRPIPDNCKLEFLHFHSPNPALVNKAFWRSCSFLLGSVAMNAFKDNVNVHLHSFPSPNGKLRTYHLITLILIKSKYCTVWFSYYHYTYLTMTKNFLFR